MQTTSGNVCVCVCVVAVAVVCAAAVRVAGGRQLHPLDH